MIEIQVSEKIKRACPDFIGVAIGAVVRNSEHDESLWKKIDVFSETYKASHKMEEIKNNLAIAATRQAYKLFGKDPNRYRPSAESLLRRILRGLPLYQVDTLVDLINLVSISTGYSIGGFDADKIVGNLLTLGVGEANEPYEAIGRGMLNIEGLPVYRDAVGGIGTPTSDNERTKIDDGTTHLLTIINGYSGKEGLDDATTLMVSLLKEYAVAEDIEIVYF